MSARPPLHACLLAVAAATLACACARGDGGGGGDAEAPTARLSGALIDPQLDEVSGLAASRRHPGVLWLLDDGDNPARLFAVSEHGRRLGTFPVEGVTKTDWEDIAAFRSGGRSYLLLADTGDNGGLRRTLQLHVVEEPAQLRNTRLEPVWSIAFRWPDGARDCEAVAVDARRGQILLVSKKRQPPELFALPLRPSGEEVLVATRLGDLAGVPQPTAQQRRQSSRARYEGHVTSASVSPDGQTLAVITYRHLLLYSREAGQGWNDAVARPPRASELPWIPQAEAIGWSADGASLYVTGEFVPAPLYRITP